MLELLSLALVNERWDPVSVALLTFATRRFASFAFATQLTLATRHVGPLIISTQKVPRAILLGHLALLTFDIQMPAHITFAISKNDKSVSKNSKGQRRQETKGETSMAIVAISPKTGSLASKYASPK